MGAVVARQWDMAAIVARQLGDNDDKLDLYSAKVIQYSKVLSILKLKLKSKCMQKVKQFK